VTQLAARLLSRFDGERRHDAEAVERRLVAAIAEATRRWPGVAADAAVFADWVAARVPADTESIEAALAQLRLPELYLTCACASGSEPAIAVFDAEFIARDRRSSDDEKQQLRQKLFLSDGDTPPRIVRYGGRGDLGRWVRTVAARLAIDGARAPHELSTDDALLDALSLDRGPSPEHAQLKQDARKIVQTALNEAFAELPARERTILLQYHIDGVGVVELGRLYDVAPSTISRNLARIRGFLLARVRRSLMCHHKLWGEELDRLIAFAQSQLSLGGALRGA
jgi:RNA polymerase sigma-70 factor (ECF subfamily)